MKAKELMIGDIVMAHLEDGGKAIDFPVVIDGLDENQALIDGTYAISWRPLKKEHGYLECADYIEPIPLTKEILKANGFAVQDDGWHVWNDGINSPNHVYVSISLYRDGTVRHIEIRTKGNHINSWLPKNVHELQHALRLVGLSDFADNLKI